MASHKEYTRQSLFDLKDRVALVTGGGSGIGLMIAHTLAVNGAKVYITGRTAEKLDTVVKTYGKDIEGELVPVTCDVTSKEQIAKLYEDLSQREKCLCILVNNAGIAGNTIDTEARSADEFKQKAFDSQQSTFEDWVDVYKSDVASIYFTTTAFLPMLQKSTELHHGWSGTVINIASISGLIQKSQRHFAYNSAKAASIHLTTLLAGEAVSNKLKVRVNSISPGYFPSEMSADGSDDKQKSHLSKEKFEDQVPAGRPGRDEDMAGTVLFLASNQYMTGQNLVLDGGLVLSTGA